MLSVTVIVLVIATAVFAQERVTRDQRGAPSVAVTASGDKWTVAGKKNTFVLNAADLSLDVRAGSVRWTTLASRPDDMMVKSAGKELSIKLADAQRKLITPYDTGAKTGIKITLSGWTQAPALVLYLTLALEGRDDEMVFEIAADESSTHVRRLDWPTALDAREVDFTVLNHYRGILLPRNWAKAFNPIRGDQATDTSEVQSDVIECWSQSWWGFQKGRSAMMIIVETSDDAAYQFSHPAGGPTVIGPRWRAQLGRLGYPRSGRMIFFENGNYVDLAKRYRRYAMETGLWVPLTAKIARTPSIASLIGSTESRVSILRNIVKESRLYDKDRPERNYRLNTFDDRAKQFRELKAKGLERFHVVLTGWPRMGYDREHPDVLPPAPAAGGYEGLKRLADTLRELGYTFSLHDQYRDYYVDSPSYDRQFAVHDEVAETPPARFPGTRFGSSKEGRLSYLTAWDGGKQTYLNARFMLGHLKKNYAGIFENGVRPMGSYLDVFGYVPPDEDFNPEHPTTRTDAKREIAKLYLWARMNLGIVGTEAGADWTVPYTDYSSPLGAGRAGVPVPLFNLVYHDAVMMPFTLRSPEELATRSGRPEWLYGMLNGGLPRVDFNSIDKVREGIRKMSELHRRIALLEMTKHEFLNPGFTRERTTFSDGTTVTVDWETKTATIAP
jgi:hypothetical protein